MTTSARTSIRARSARLQRVVAVAEIALWLLLLLERFGAAGLRVFEHGEAAEWQALAVHAIAAVPDALYLLALDCVRRALGAFAQGQLFDATITRMLERVGVLLAAGALFGVFLVPSLQWLVGAGPGYLIAFDVSGVVLGALGLSLGVIARVLGHAATVQAELDEIF